MFEEVEYNQDKRQNEEISVEDDEEYENNLEYLEQQPEISSDFQTFDEDLSTQPTSEAFTDFLEAI